MLALLGYCLPKYPCSSPTSPSTPQFGTNLKSELYLPFFQPEFGWAIHSFSTSPSATFPDGVNMALMHIPIPEIGLHPRSWELEGDCPFENETSQGSPFFRLSFLTWTSDWPIEIHHSEQKSKGSSSDSSITFNPFHSCPLTHSWNWGRKWRNWNLDWYSPSPSKNKVELHGAPGGIQWSSHVTSPVPLRCS